MIEQYEAKNKSNFVKSETPKYDLKNYFNTFIEKGVKSATKNIRILPTKNGESPFVEVHVHPMKIDGDSKKFACLKEEKGLPCPFCEAREALLATGKESDKELAKNYKSKLVYVVKIIDRDKPEEGVKFWRINHDWRKEGVYDKIYGISSALKKDITNSETGRDLAILINRNQNDIPVVSSVTALDPSPLSTDAAQAELWLSDDRTWENVYSVKNYDYLEILVKGGSPVWDKEAKKFVDKAALKPESDNTEGEITMGVENVKAGVKAATATATPATPEAEGDDLPF
jgi:hypothetical protein